jgi:hypothetical protein
VSSNSGGKKNESSPPTTTTTNSGTKSVIIKGYMTAQLSSKKPLCHKGKKALVA